MKKILQRLLVFAVGLPLITGITLFLPHFNHLVLNIVVVVFSALGALEFAAILRPKGMSVHPAEALILGALAPAVMTVQGSLGKGPALSAALALGALWLPVSQVFSPEEKLKGYTERAAAGFSLILYPGLFMAFIVWMSRFPQAGVVILTFLFIVFANDSAAWAVGMLFGKGNRGLIPASPNKSIAGFIGGITVSILIGAGAELYIRSAFISRLLPAPLGGAITGFCTGIAANLGDLVESAMKRSSGMKDSGRLIPGRGGVLDCIDSVSLAAPVFYILYRLIF
ncbi:MAG: phosphatidate cytidylyltransferase [Treponema sp.]|jgi:phosphatidate cytidylyltransferase|nr:phosphatidate cytidylyltransferase [Treponema sp.]